MTTLQPPGAPLDWNLGHYEHTAAQLLPASRLVVECAAPTGAERVLDLGCGTGNATLLAAALGARVTAIDPAPRLLDIARRRVAEAGLDARFAAGDAATLPLEDGAADLVLSVFGVVFAPDPLAAAAEIARVTAPTGRIVFSAWVPDGAISQAVGLARAAVRKALCAPEGPPPFAWHEPRALGDLLAPYGFSVATQEEHLAFTAASAVAFLDAESYNHPLLVAGRAILEPRGEAEALRERMLAIYAGANEDRDGFRVTSRYVVATARR